MDWYYESNVNDFLVPKDHDLLDRHPSPNWGLCAIEDQSCSSGVCGGLSEQSFQQTTLSCDLPNYHQLQDLPTFELMNDIFLDSVPEDLPYVDKQDKFFNNSPENECGNKPGVLQNDIADSKLVSCDSESKDYLDIEVPLGKVLDSFEQCSRRDGMHEQLSLEEFILKDLGMVIGKFTERTRVCFRDALYRLARNTEQKHAPHDRDGDLNRKKAMPHTDHNETVRSQDQEAMESETNSIDRVIANLLFNNMEFNMHGPPLTSPINSMQQVIGSKNGECSKFFNLEQMSHNPHPQNLPADANQQRDTGTHIACGDPIMLL